MHETNYSQFLNHRNLDENFEKLEGIKVTESEGVNNEIDINDIKVNTLQSSLSHKNEQNR